MAFVGQGKSRRRIQPPPLVETLENLGYSLINEVIPQKLPETGIFHYTSSEGLRGILESNSLRFSDCLFLNDGSEVHYANQLLNDAIERFASGKPYRVGKFVQEAGQHIARTAYENRPVVFCLSGKPNLLNQWRDYGRDIVPYCFELDAQSLLAEDWSFRCDLVEMIYEEELQKKILDDILSRFYSAIRPRIKEFVSHPDVRQLIDSMTLQIWSALIRFKHPAFAAEQEWRLLSYQAWTVGQITEFRSSTLGVVPFLSRSPRKGTLLPITSVLVGPSPYGRVSQQALNMFLSAKGYDIPTFASAIPAR